MAKRLLPENKRVVFNSESHEYILDGTTSLSGITSIISKYIFKEEMYAGVSDAILERAKERGSAIHNELHLEFLGLPAEKPSPEVAAFRELVKECGIKQVDAEYLISDNEHVATCIDAVWKQGKNFALADYKTTSKLHIEYLRWQLSIEAYLFEKQTGKKVERLYAVHLPKPKDDEKYKAGLEIIERLPDEYVISLLDAYISGAESFTNPLHEMSGNTDELLKQYANAELALAELKASVRYYEQIEADVKAQFKSLMDEESASKWENDQVVITRSKDSTRRTFKLDLLKSNATPEVSVWLNDNLDKCYQETTVAGNVSIKFKAS